jgi:hypothetical protein
MRRSPCPPDRAEPCWAGFTYAWRGPRGAAAREGWGAPLPRRIFRRAALAPALLLAGCAAAQSAAAVQPQAPGFLYGVWHGFIFPVAWIVSLFMPDVSIYAVPNNGGWYDFGYFIGVVFLGVGARHARRR